MTASASPYALTVRAFARRVSLRLLAWSGLSMAGGALLWLRGAPFWRSFGLQALAWGAIDALIALVGLAGQRRSTAVTDAAAGREAQKLRRLLWFNALLDVGYVAGGAWLARTRGRNDPAWRGHGWGIVVQGLFLFGFDLYHARRTPRAGD